MTRDQRVRAAMDRMVREAPRITTEIGFHRRTCILHARIATVVLNELGIRARPLACKLLVANSEWAHLMAELGRDPEPADWQDRDDVWALGVGYGQGDTPGYDAHVVVVVEERYVMDLTIDQANRPKYGMILAPVHWPVPADFLTGVAPAWFDVNGTLVKYQAIPGDKAFLRVPDWTEVVKPGRAPSLNPIPRLRAAMAA